MSKRYVIGFIIEILGLDRYGKGTNFRKLPKCNGNLTSSFENCTRCTRPGIDRDLTRGQWEEGRKSPEIGVTRKESRSVEFRRRT